MTTIHSARGLLERCQWRSKNRPMGRGKTRPVCGLRLLRLLEHTPPKSTIARDHPVPSNRIPSIPGHRFRGHSESSASSRTQICRFSAHDEFRTQWEMPIGARELNHHASYYSKQARCVRVCNRMTTAEAPAAQVKEKDLKRYFRVDGKTNMTAPAEAATWFKLISVPHYNNPAHPTPMETKLALPQVGNYRASLPATHRTHWRECKPKSIAPIGDMTHVQVIGRQSYRRRSRPRPI
jgi:hypothetical protein